MQTIRRLSIALVVLALAGCAAFTTKGSDPVPTPTQAEQIQQIDQIRTVAEAVVDTVTNVYQGEIAFYDHRKPDGGRYITPKQHIDVANAVSRFTEETREALATVRDLAESPQTRRTAAEKLLDSGIVTLNRIVELSPAMKSYVDTALRLIKALVLPRL